MKKLLFITIPALALAITVSCSKETTGGERQDSGVKSPVTEFKATLEEAAVAKTSFNDTTKAVSWKLGDEIAVIDETGAIFKFIAKSAGKKTTFVKSKDSEGQLSGSTFYAVFPYSDALRWDNATKVATVNTATSRTVKPNDFGNAYAAVMTACTTTDSLHFKNLCNLFEFTVPAGLKVTSIYLFANGQDLSAKEGAGVSIAADGTPAISAKPSTYNGITISPAQKDSVNFTAGKYYIPVLPGDYKDLRCKMTYDDGTVSEAFSLNGFTAARNSITNIGTLYDGRSFYKWLTFEDGNVPASIIDTAGTVTIEDNVRKGNANPSKKMYQSYTASGTTSGYITVDLSGISSSIRKNIKGLKFQIIYDSNQKFYSRIKYAVNGGALSESSYNPSTLNGKTFTDQADFNSKVISTYWNTVEYKADLFGLENFETVTKIQIRQSKWYGSAASVDAPVTFQIDNIGFTYE